MGEKKSKNFWFPWKKKDHEKLQILRGPEPLHYKFDQFSNFTFVHFVTSSKVLLRP